MRRRGEKERREREKGSMGSNDMGMERKGSQEEEEEEKSQKKKKVNQSVSQSVSQGSFFLSFLCFVLFQTFALRPLFRLQRDKDE